MSQAPTSGERKVGTEVLQAFLRAAACYVAVYVAVKIIIDLNFSWLPQYLFLAGISTAAVAQDRSASNPPDLPPATGYSHVVVAPKGRLVVISGQVALDSQGNLVGGDDFEKQCIQVHENLSRALASVRKLPHLGHS